jgi:uncharacterized membrane protein
MSVAYGPPGQPPYPVPTGRVNFGWINESWQIFSRAAGTWISAVAIYVLMIAAVLVPFEIWMFSNRSALTAGSSGPYMINPSNPLFAPYWTMEIVIIAVELFMTASMYRMALKQVRGEPIRLSDAFSGAPAMGRLFLFYILSGLFNIIGLLALIVGCAVTYGLLFPGFAMVADGEKPTIAFKKSLAAMKGDWLTGALFIFVLFLLLFVSELPCLLGLLATLPMFHICSALAYRDMVGMEGIHVPDYGYQLYQTPVAGTWPPPPGAPHQEPYGQTWPPPVGSEDPEPPQVAE